MSNDGAELSDWALDQLHEIDDAYTANLEKCERFRDDAAKLAELQERRNDYDQQILTICSIAPVSVPKIQSRYSDE